MQLKYTNESSESIKCKKKEKKQDTALKETSLKTLGKKKSFQVCFIMCFTVSGALRCGGRAFHSRGAAHYLNWLFDNAK